MLYISVGKLRGVVTLSTADGNVSLALCAGQWQPVDHLLCQDGWRSAHEQWVEQQFEERRPSKQHDQRVALDVTQRIKPYY
eukprot:4911918-Amphidinium_carterae.1